MALGCCGPHIGILDSRSQRPEIPTAADPKPKPHRPKSPTAYLLTRRRSPAVDNTQYAGRCTPGRRLKRCQTNWHELHSRPTACKLRTCVILHDCNCSCTGGILPGDCSHRYNNLEKKWSPANPSISRLCRAIKLPESPLETREMASEVAVVRENVRVNEEPLLQKN